MNDIYVNKPSISVLISLRLTFSGARILICNFEILFEVILLTFSTCAGSSTFSFCQASARASCSAEQHPLPPEHAGSDHKHDAPDPVPAIPWFPGGADDRSQARHCFCGVRGREPVHGCNGSPPGFQDQPREPNGHLIRQKVKQIHVISEPAKRNL